MQLEAILSVKDIEKSFPGNQVLKKVSMSVLPGEVMGLVGENGAGKSTLMKIITGVYSFDAGEIMFEGRSVSFDNPKEALKQGIAIIHQEFNLFQNLSVAENIFLDRSEYLGKLGKVQWKKMEKEAQAVLGELGANFDVDTLVSDIGVREQQLVEIAKAVSSNSKVIIMDEPSAALPQNEVGHLFDVINILKSRGCAIIYVSHRMKEIEEICDRVTVLRNGVNVGTLVMAKSNIQDIVTMMCGREIGEYYPHTLHVAGNTALKVSDLTTDFLKNISFEIKEQEIIGLYGLAGSGSTELAESLFGLSKIDNGEIETSAGKAVKGKYNPKKAMELGFSYVPPDRHREGIVKELSIEKNLILAQMSAYTKLGFMSRKKIEESSKSYIKQLNIRTTSSKQYLLNLSGGNQQKVVLARWLDVGPRILILNEPTRGVDIGAKVEIYTLIDKLAKSGLAILLISSEIPEVLGMCDRILVMNKGAISGEYENKGLEQETLLSAASGTKEGRL